MTAPVKLCGNFKKRMIPPFVCCIIRDAGNLKPSTLGYRRLRAKSSYGLTDTQ
ncbi:hypothetical protein D3C83_160180 [compost metagenome]